MREHQQHLSPTAGGRGTALRCAASTGGQSPWHRLNGDFWFLAAVPSAVMCVLGLPHASERRSLPLYHVARCQPLPSPVTVALAPFRPNVHLLEIIPRLDAHRSVFVVSLSCGHKEIPLSVNGEYPSCGYTIPKVQSLADFFFFFKEDCFCR